MQKWQCKVSPTLGELDGTQNDTWGTVDYTDDKKPCVFMGIYGMPDFYSLWRHKGKRAILWCGSDIRHFAKGYWLEDRGKSHLDPFMLGSWIQRNCVSYVENKVERDALLLFGIHSKIVPSFVGDIEKYKISFSPGNKLYTSVSGNDYKVYGWDKIKGLAKKNRDIEFHLYGNTGKPFMGKNIFDHGRVPKEQMNDEIKSMQGALRLTEFDGASEILVKSALMGQYPVSLIKYPYTLGVSNIRDILRRKSPNFKARNWWIGKINKFPWNKNSVI